MTVSKLELKCYEYVNAIKDISEYMGCGLYGLDKIRATIHDEICLLSGLPKTETQAYTDNLDKLDYNGTELYLKLLSHMRNPAEKVKP